MKGSSQDGSRLRLSEVVLTAAGLDDAERDAYLGEVAAADPDLVAEARRRLAAAEAADSFLDLPAAERLDGGRAPREETLVDIRDLEAPIPERIGPYRVTGRLGRGGMGEVLRGHDDRLDRPVALKRVHPGGRNPEEARQRLRREARAVARLSDSAIVQVHDWVEAEEQDWLVMELVNGRTLREVLAEGPIERERALRIARRIADGLSKAHEAGLVHRDLKPANVMLVAGDGASPERVKILDFGLAKPVELDGAAPLSTLTAEGQVLGTVTAMSPEQAMGHAIDHRSDLFALGTLLYEMLSDESPFAGNNAIETLTRICSWKQNPLDSLDPEIPEELSDFVDRLLEKEPARRPADARAVVAELDRLLTEPAAESGSGEGLPGTTDPPTIVDGGPHPLDARIDARTAASLEKAAGGKPRGWMLLAAGVLIVAVLWGLSSWLRPPAEEPPGVGASGVAARDPGNGEEVSTVYQEGMALLERFDRKGNLDQAVELFEALVARYPESAVAFAGLARALWRKHWVFKDNHWLERALPVAERAVELEPYLASAQVSLGLVKLALGELDAASVAFELALRLNPASAEIHRGLGQFHEVRGELENAELSYRRALEIRPQSWELHDQLGSLYFRQSHLDEAAAEFEQSIAAAPDNIPGLSSLSGVYFMQGRYDEAAAELQKAIAIRPNAMLYTNLGNIFFYQGLYEQAITPFRQAVELEEGTKDPLMWGNLGDACRWVPGREKEALAAYRQGIAVLREDIAVRPGEFGIRSRLALYLARSGGCKEAITTAEGLESSEEIDASTWFRLALTYEQCGKRQRALATLGRALADGYPPVAVEREQELDRLRTDPGFHRLQAAYPG